MQGKKADYSRENMSSIRYSQVPEVINQDPNKEQINIVYGNNERENEENTQREMNNRQNKGLNGGNNGMENEENAQREMNNRQNKRSNGGNNEVENEENAQGEMNNSQNQRLNGGGNQNREEYQQQYERWLKVAKKDGRKGEIDQIQYQPLSFAQRRQPYPYPQISNKVIICMMVTFTFVVIGAVLSHKGSLQAFKVKYIQNSYHAFNYTLQTNHSMGILPDNSSISFVTYEVIIAVNDIKDERVCFVGATHRKSEVFPDKGENKTITNNQSLYEFGKEVLQQGVSQQQFPSAFDFFTFQVSLEDNSFSTLNYSQLTDDEGIWVAFSIVQMFAPPITKHTNQPKNMFMDFRKDRSLQTSPETLSIQSDGEENMSKYSYEQSRTGTKYFKQQSGVSGGEDLYEGEEQRSCYTQLYLDGSFKEAQCEGETIFKAQQLNSSTDVTTNFIIRRKGYLSEITFEPKAKGVPQLMQKVEDTASVTIQSSDELKAEIIGEKPEASCPSEFQDGQWECTKVVQMFNCTLSGLDWRASKYLNIKITQNQHPNRYKYSQKVQCQVGIEIKLGYQIERVPLLTCGEVAIDSLSITFTKEKVQELAVKLEGDIQTQAKNISAEDLNFTDGFKQAALQFLAGVEQLQYQLNKTLSQQAKGLDISPLSLIIENTVNTIESLHQSDYLIFENTRNELEPLFDSYSGEEYPKLKQSIQKIPAYNFNNLVSEVSQREKSEVEEKIEAYLNYSKVESLLNDYISKLNQTEELFYDALQSIFNQTLALIPPEHEHVLTPLLQQIQDRLAKVDQELQDLKKKVLDIPSLKEKVVEQMRKMVYQPLNTTKYSQTYLQSLNTVVDSYKNSLHNLTDCCTYTEYSLCVLNENVQFCVQQHNDTCGGDCTCIKPNQVYFEQTWHLDTLNKFVDDHQETVINMAQELEKWIKELDVIIANDEQSIENRHGMIVAGFQALQAHIIDLTAVIDTINGLSNAATSINGLQDCDYSISIQEYIDYLNDLKQIVEEFFDHYTQFDEAYSQYEVTFSVFNYTIIVENHNITQSSVQFLDHYSNMEHLAIQSINNVFDATINDTDTFIHDTIGLYDKVGLYVKILCIERQQSQLMVTNLRDEYRDMLYIIQALNDTFFDNETSSLEQMLGNGTELYQSWKEENFCDLSKEVSQALQKLQQVLMSLDLLNSLQDKFSTAWHSSDTFISQLRENLALSEKALPTSITSQNYKSLIDQMKSSQKEFITRISQLYKVMNQIKQQTSNLIQIDFQSFDDETLQSIAEPINDVIFGLTTGDLFEGADAYKEAEEVLYSQELLAFQKQKASVVLNITLNNIIEEMNSTAQKIRTVFENTMKQDIDLVYVEFQAVKYRLEQINFDKVNEILALTDEQTREHGQNIRDSLSSIKENLTFTLESSFDTATSLSHLNNITSFLSQFLFDNSSVLSSESSFVSLPEDVQSDLNQLSNYENIISETNESIIQRYQPIQLIKQVIDQIDPMVWEQMQALTNSSNISQLLGNFIMGSQFSDELGSASNSIKDFSDSLPEDIKESRLNFEKSDEVLSGKDLQNIHKHYGQLQRNIRQMQNLSLINMQTLPEAFEAKLFNFTSLSNQLFGKYGHILTVSETYATDKIKSLLANLKVLQSNLNESKDNFEEKIDAFQDFTSSFFKKTNFTDYANLQNSETEIDLIQTSPEDDINSSVLLNIQTQNSSSITLEQSIPNTIGSCLVTADLIYDVNQSMVIELQNRRNVLFQSNFTMILQMQNVYFSNGNEQQYRKGTYMKGIAVDGEVNHEIGIQNIKQMELVSSLTKIGSMKEQNRMSGATENFLDLDQIEIFSGNMTKIDENISQKSKKQKEEQKIHEESDQGMLDYIKSYE